ncbi:hypothetical protein CWE09_07310 [Aliidiomarina minuta]|uniref:Uncharacterized protein n=1 Tax=Aliidiomarina minuta TaxID=880057 RepID=A0A432W8N4_9GAMM|nr:hypothetical protein [Aliidiomarina minuta]RUO26507.1 hypothetical protein CWE09_07310 [Aliidiomarina minuta]
MGPFEIGAIAIVLGCALEGYRIYTKKQATGSSSEMKAMQGELSTLKERVAALESIVTDKSYQLKEEFKRL